METLPNWLAAAVEAAGMTTAYVEELDGKAELKAKARAAQAEQPEEPPLLH